MSKVHWTGHPFVDAGLSALAAVARVQQLGHLMAKHLDEAVKQLKRILLSDQALGLGVKKAFARTAMSYLFPNSELVNPMHWRSDKTPLQNANNVRQKFSKALEEDLKRAKRCLQSDGGDAICYACGERRPAEAMVTMRKDKMPLLEGIVNFYPALAFGVQICGLCALAVRFLPLSVMRTGTKNRMWFLHAQSLPITATIARTYGWEHFNRLIAKDEPLDFFSSWETAGDAGMVLYLLCELLERYGDVLIETYQNPLPTTAYLFSNSNRGGFIQPLPIPNELLLFLAKLQLQSQRAFRRFWRELLQIPASLSKGEREARIKFVQLTANCLLNVQSIIAKCLDHNTPKLRGGWRGHRLYLK
ncbi:MAG TPA: type I-B CRISPR-associated protein Cas8b1/Cst1, partial [Armatimonadetes bacterium]|nr:type I-B CRISPR-associated protein Cas8b1/Cst1 [Armatimonadota bacterium]